MVSAKTSRQIIRRARIGRILEELRGGRVLHQLTQQKECDRIGKSPKCILKAIGVDSLEHLTVERFQSAMEAFKKTPDKSKGKVDPATVPPEDETSGLPFN